MIMISLIFAFIMLIGIYFYWKKNRAAPINRYRKTKPVENNATHHVKNDDDNNDALDLSNAEEKLSATTPASKTKPINPQSDCVVVLYLMASEESAYAGYELLQALLSAGMRYGKQCIFHRHAHQDGRGDILFHCASATEPGTFDLTKMGAFSCTGLCLFFSANSVDEPLSTFDCLLETIDQLVEDLGGKVLDEKHILFTKERMVKYRQQIRAVENSRTTVDLFESIE